MKIHNKTFLQQIFIGIAVGCGFGVILQLILFLIN